jgi:hypothetical protein
MTVPGTIRATGPQVTTPEPSVGTSAGPGRRAGRSAPAPLAAPPKTRRRTGVLAAGVALVALGSLGAAYLTQSVGDTVPVLAVARDVMAGEPLQAADLVVADVNADPALSPVPASQLEALIGRRTAVALPAGSLLTDAAVATTVVPAAGRSMVGVALTPAQLPAEPLQAGDRVRIVDTPTNQGDPPSTTPATISGEVVSTVGPDDTGLTVVNVTVPTSQAPDLAARVATGRVALILDSRER